MATLSLRDRITDVRWWFGIRNAVLDLPPPTLSVTVLIPAYNKEDIIEKVVASIKAQTYSIDRIIVIDDRSKDRTFEVASAIPDILVLQTPQNTGTKAGAQNYGLDYMVENGLQTDIFVTVDGDTILREDALWHLLRGFNHEQAIIVSGSIVSLNIDSIWERGRHIQHMVNAALIRPSQSHNDALLVASGCFGAYHMERFLEVLGRFPQDTIVEDLEATLRIHESKKYRVFYESRAICYTIDPPTFKIFVAQLERWYRGFMRSLIDRKGNVFKISADIGFDICFFLFFLVLGPLTLPFSVYALVTGNAGGWLQVIAFSYLIGMSIVSLVVGMRAYRLGLLWKTFTSIPALFVVQFVDVVMYGHAFWMEVIRRKTLTNWDPVT